jgi:SAM-dependent methyltransferase
VGRTWQDFWNRPQHLYVNDEHALRLYRQIADGILDAGRPTKGQTWLDFGCGEALGAPVLMRAGINLLLYDRSDRMRTLVQQRFGGLAGWRPLDPPAYDALPPESVDGISVVSVVQYLRPAELRTALARWYRLLRPGGRLVLGDLIPRRSPPGSDVLALLRYCRRNGYFLSGVRGLLATFFSDYGSIRKTAGLACYDEEDLPDLFDPLGFSWTRYRPNLGVNQARMTVVATKPGAS